MAELAAPLPRHVVSHVDDFLHVAPCLGDNLAHLLGHLLGEFLFFRDDTIGDLKQHFRPFRRGDQPPGFVGFLRRRHRRIDIGFVGFLELPQIDSCIRRVDIVEEPAGI